MTLIKGTLTGTEAAVDSKRVDAKKQIPDYTKGTHVFEVKGMCGQTIEWTNNPLNAIKTAKECKTPATVFEIPLNTKGPKKEIFRNETATHAMM